MSRRRPFALAAVAVTLLGATFAAAPAAVAAPGDPNQVALVVDYPDGSTRSFCVGYRSGMSGADVLAVAGPSYGTGPYAGFVLRIGGQGTVPPTSSNYWAYWVTQGGGLVYSGSGVTSTRPRAGTVEAWHWNSSGSAESPSGGSYAALCPGGFAATPAPAATTPAPTPTGVAAPTGSGGGGAVAGTTAPGGAGDTTASGTTGSGPPAASGSPTAPTSTSPTGSASAGGSGSPGASTSVAASAVAATDDSGGLGTGSTVGLIVAAVAVLALGALAVVARRRRAEQD